MKKLVVTGYVPIPKHPRSAQVYGELGQKLGSLSDYVDIYPIYQTLSDCWMWRFIGGMSVIPAEADNREKNTLAYHCVQHQKFQWLLDAHIKYPDYDSYIWMDYGIFGIPGLEREPAIEFLKRIVPGTRIPGCWHKLDPRVTDMHDYTPCWRFLGSLMVVDKRDIPMLYNATKLMAAKRIVQTKLLTWEVNTLTRVEKEDVLPIRWYQADHNNSMFTEY